MDCGRSGASAPNRTADIQCRSFLQFLQEVLPEFCDFRPDYESAVGLRRISPEVFLMVILRHVELRGGGLPSGILPAQPRAALLRLGSQAESRKIPEVLSGKTEEMTWNRMSAVRFGAQGPGPTAVHSQPALRA